MKKRSQAWIVIFGFVLPDTAPALSERILVPIAASVSAPSPYSGNPVGTGSQVDTELGAMALTNVYTPTSSLGYGVTFQTEPAPLSLILGVSGAAPVYGATAGFAIVPKSGGLAVGFKTDWTVTPVALSSAQLSFLTNPRGNFRLGLTARSFVIGAGPFIPGLAELLVGASVALGSHLRVALDGGVDGTFATYRLIPGAALILGPLQIGGGVEVVRYGSVPVAVARGRAGIALALGKASAFGIQGETPSTVGVNLAIGL